VPRDRGAEAFAHCVAFPLFFIPRKKLRPQRGEYYPAHDPGVGQIVTNRPNATRLARRPLGTPQRALSFIKRNQMFPSTASFQTFGHLEM
jgi:hypothetical protein